MDAGEGDKIDKGGVLPHGSEQPDNKFVDVDEDLGSCVGVGEGEAEADIDVALALPVGFGVPCNTGCAIGL